MILSECAEYKTSGKMVEKHCKSVIFHHELFMDITEVTDRKLVRIKLLKHSHPFMKRTHLYEGLPYGPHL